MALSTNTRPLPITFTIPGTKIDRFTSLLQSGMRLPAPSGLSLGVFIDSLPGFDIDYISNTVQTIFLDGNAIDDLEHPLTRPDHVLALSAAMPGLAGAIFRRNSLCAALRTRSNTSQPKTEDNHELYILLKLFNSIAQEKGGELLRLGGVFSGETLRSFFQQRPSLLEVIQTLLIDGENLAVNNLLLSLSDQKQYYLKITTTEQRETTNGQ